MFSGLRDFDFYRKIPKDLTEASTPGVVLSVVSLLFMLALFLLELTSFLSPDFATNMILDPNTDQRLRINFNITVLDMVIHIIIIRNNTNKNNYSLVNLPLLM